MKSIFLIAALSPLLGAFIVGLFPVNRKIAHWVANIGVFISFLCSIFIFYLYVIQNIAPINITVYTWAISGGVNFQIGFLVDTLTATMMLIVTTVSWMVHIYTIGYMQDDEHNWSEIGCGGIYSYQRFFAYISLFTFSMLLLVMSNNFLQLFFAWEAVGLVSYLLIGFWFQRSTAVFANFKAFLVNRVGDFGFLLGIALILGYFGTLNYSEVFEKLNQFSNINISIWPSQEWHVITVIAILLFIGAMGKSAQMPLHVWLPDSMEGPTPISALIHAATMVTAGIFMVARMSPLYELSPVALSFILIIGALTALFMGFLGLVQTDIKRVVAYSTLSQLGYMTAALGASAYNAAIFHLMTHAFFKALLFLSAGSVIMAMHHQQDMRVMGGLRKYMPITWITALIGSLALIGFPGTAGFYSKDSIIEALHFAHLNHRIGAEFAYYCLLIGIFITALYSFRMYFMVFHGKPRMDEHTLHHLHENSRVITIPLIILAIPSIFIGAIMVGSILTGLFDGAIYMVQDPFHDVLHSEGKIWLDFLIHGMFPPSLPVILSLLGVITAWILYGSNSLDLNKFIGEKFYIFRVVLDNKYYFDFINEKIIALFTRRIGIFFWKSIDTNVIDGMMVNGTAYLINRLSNFLRLLQTGFLYHYAFIMSIGLAIMLSWFIFFQ